MYNLTDKIKIIDLALLLKSTLIISDLHIGYEAELNKTGIMIPRFSFKDIMSKFKKILDECKDKIDTIVINGDFKDAFGTINNQEWSESLKIIDFLVKYGKVVLIKGNHDKNLSFIAEKRNIELIDSYVIENVLITHGDKIVDIDKNIRTIIIGHEHPAVVLKDNNRSEKFKCFLKGKYKEQELIVIPSFNPVSIGTDVLDNKHLSPFLQQDISDFLVYVVGNEILEFGRIRDLV